MAIVRCLNHPVHEIGAPKKYVLTVMPIGYPDTAVICGRKKCEHSGLVWLTEDEMKQYDKGTSIFDLDTNTTRVKVIPFDTLGYDQYYRRST